MAGDELVTVLGVELSATALANIRKFQAGIDSVMSQLRTFSVVATGLAVAAGMVISRAVDEAAAMQTLSDKTGVSTDALQEWGYAAGQVGVDAKSVQTDLVALTKSMSSPIPGQFNANLAMIGVSARDSNGALRDSGDILEDLGGRMEGMSAQKAMQWGQKIGISDDTVLLLRQGKEGIAKLRTEAHSLGAIIPSEAIKRAAAFKTQITSFQAVLKSLTSQIAIATVPALSRVIDLFKGWITENRTWIALHTESFMTGLVTAFERVWGAGKKFLEFLRPLTDKFKDLTGWMDTTDMYTHMITGALALLAVAFAPVLFAVAKAALLFGALALIAEDVFGYLNGEDSVTGLLLDSLAEKFPGVAKLFGVLKDVAVSLFQGAIEPGIAIAMKLGSAMGDVFNAIGGFIDYAAGRWADFIDTFTGKYPALVEVVTVLGGIIGTLLGGAIDLVVSAVSGLFEVAKKVFGWLFDAMEKGMSGLNTLAEWAGFGGDKKADEKADATAAEQPATAPAGRSASPVPVAPRESAREGTAPSASSGSGGSRSAPAPVPESTPAPAPKRVPAPEAAYPALADYARAPASAMMNPTKRPVVPPVQDMTQYAPAPTVGAAVMKNPTVRDAAAGETQSTTKSPPATGNSAPTINDNRSVVQHISTSDPVQAGNVAAQRAGGSYTQLTNPGLNAPVVR